MKLIEKKAWGYFLAMLLTIAFMTSCKSAKTAVVTEKVTETITETVHDTVFVTEQDKSTYQALLECQEGKVVIKEVTNAQAGKYLRAPKVKVKDNQVQCDCEAEAQKLHAQWKSKEKTSTRVKEVPVIMYKPLTWWQVTQIWLGRIFLAVLLIWLLKTIYNPFKFLSNGR